VYSAIEERRFEKKREKRPKSIKLRGIFRVEKKDDLKAKIANS